MIMMMVMMTMGGMVGHIKSRNRAKSRRNDLGVSPFQPCHDDLEIKFFCSLCHAQFEFYHGKFINISSKEAKQMLRQTLEQNNHASRNANASQSVFN